MLQAEPIIFRITEDPSHTFAEHGPTPPAKIIQVSNSAYNINK